MHDPDTTCRVLAGTLASAAGGACTGACRRGIRVPAHTGAVARTRARHVLVCNPTCSRAQRLYRRQGHSHQPLAVPPPGIGACHAACLLPPSGREVLGSGRPGLQLIGPAPDLPGVCGQALGLVWAGLVGGVGGSLLDSLLGATVQATYYDEASRMVVGRPTPKVAPTLASLSSRSPLSSLSWLPSLHSLALPLPLPTPSPSRLGPARSAADDCLSPAAPRRDVWRGCRSSPTRWSTLSRPPPPPSPPPPRRGCCSAGSRRRSGGRRPRSESGERRTLAVARSADDRRGGRSGGRTHFSYSRILCDL